jgi:hypothetical protein
MSTCYTMAPVAAAAKLSELAIDSGHHQEPLMRFDYCEQAMLNNNASSIC